MDDIEKQQKMGGIKNDINPLLQYLTNNPVEDLVPL